MKLMNQYKDDGDELTKVPLGVAETWEDARCSVIAIVKVATGLIFVVSLSPACKEKRVDWIAPSTASRNQ